MTHTPGPWRIQGEEVLSDFTESPAVYRVIRDRSERWTALVEVGDDEGEATARLIAAAPDILAALVRMVEENEPAREDSPRRDGWNLARAAIRKATEGV